MAGDQRTGGMVQRVTSPSTRPDHRVLVVGAGFAGIGMGIKLKQAGIDDFVLLEKDTDLGGTWRDNSYPGCACDVPSPLYSFSFEQNPEWTRFFSPADEIWDYLRHCVDAYDLKPHMRYGADVQGAAYDETAGRWAVELAGGETLTARAVVTGVGALHRPRLPDIPGLDSFKGRSFHSAHWDHNHDLTGRRVAVIGTGASAIQFVPQIQPAVEQLDVYQRTAPWVTPKPDREISDLEKSLFRRVPAAMTAFRAIVYAVLETRALGFAVHPRFMALIERNARRHLARQVPDVDLRARLTPDYQIGCKRILLSNDYYPALSQPNVELVTTGIERVTPTGIVDRSGVARPVDTIVLGTGFQVTGNLTRLRLRGLGGEDLADTWRRKGAGAHLGISVSGFPNLFLLVGPNTGLGHSSMIYMIESQVAHVIHALRLGEQHGGAVDVRQDVQDAYVEDVQGHLDGSVWQSGCSSWYIDETGRNTAIWPRFSWQYRQRTRRLRPHEYAIVPT